MRGNRDKIFLERILESSEIIENHLAGYEFTDFVNDKKTYDAVLMQLVNIGEMVSRLSSEFKEKHHTLPFYEIVGMRNQIAHGYFEIKEEVVWNTSKKDVPDLKKHLETLI